MEDVFNAIAGISREKSNSRSPSSSIFRDYDARRQGISTIEWKVGVVGQHPLVMVAAEVAVTAGFISDVAWAKEEGNLAMTMFDEAHVVVKDETWREVMLQMWKLAEISPRRITMSATVPQYIEAGLTTNLSL